MLINVDLAFSRALEPKCICLRLQTFRRPLESWQSPGLGLRNQEQTALARPRTWPPEVAAQPQALRPQCAGQSGHRLSAESLPPGPSPVEVAQAFRTDPHPLPTRRPLPGHQPCPLPPGHSRTLVFQEQTLHCVTPGSRGPCPEGATGWSFISSPAAPPPPSIWTSLVVYVKC